MQKIEEGYEHFTYPVKCRQCGWVGFNGELIAGMRPKPWCPKCESMDIEPVNEQKTTPGNVK